jgi:endonuclease-3
MEELISCILSQSSSDASSFPAFTRLRATFPDWGEMEAAGPDGIVELIRKAGLANQKSKNIISCLRLIREHAGDYSLEFLREMSDEEAVKWLTTLPGVGLKTASIVLCFAFGRAAIPVDTHIFRVSSRLGLLKPGSNETKAHQELLEAVPPADAFRFHTLLIQHGRLTCRAPQPLCAVCVLGDICPKKGVSKG